MSGDRLDLLARIQELERENKELKEYTNTQPYKFEDLKEQMFVYEINLDNVFQIEYTTENIETKEKFVYGFGCGVSRLTKIKFEENSFFPVKREDDTKEIINIYEVIEKQIVKDINLYDCQLSVEEIEIIYLISHYARKEKILNDKDEDTLMNVIIKLDKQKEMLKNER